jgi:hypothetical protein
MPLAAKKLNRVRIMDPMDLTGSYIVLDYIDGRLSEDEEFCGKHSCFRNNTPPGRLKWRHVSPQAIIFTCDSCLMPSTAPTLMLNLPEPGIDVDPLTGQPIISIEHLCIKCNKVSKPIDSDPMPNLCDECDGNFNENGKEN